MTDIKTQDFQNDVIIELQKLSQTWVTMLLISPVFEGRRMVLDSLARLEKAETYCSATVKDAAAFPFCTEQCVNKI